MHFYNDANYYITYSSLNKYKNTLSLETEVPEHVSLLEQGLQHLPLTHIPLPHSKNKICISCWFYFSAISGSQGFFWDSLWIIWYSFGSKLRWSIYRGRRMSRYVFWMSIWHYCGTIGSWRLNTWDDWSTIVNNIIATWWLHTVQWIGGRFLPQWVCWQRMIGDYWEARFDVILVSSESPTIQYEYGCVSFDSIKLITFWLVFINIHVNSYLSLCLFKGYSCFL